jgi:hypothetical protein
VKLTKFQWLTLATVGAFLIYEFYFVSRWETTLPAGNPVIRGDLIFIYPLLLALIAVAVVQSVQNNLSKKIKVCHSESFWLLWH